MKVNHYFYAGLDFIFDEHNNYWFIEANYWPNGASNLERFEKKDRVIPHLARSLKKQGDNVAVFRPKKLAESTENMAWFYNKIKKEVPNARLCYTYKNKNRKKTLIDTCGQKFRPDSIFRFGEKVSSTFEKNIDVVNPVAIENTVNNKMLTLKIAAKTGVNTPKTFFVKGSKEAKRILAKYPKVFEHGYVIKPNDMLCGIDVKIFNKNEKFPTFRKRKLLEQRIVPHLRHKNFWDARVLVVYGKYFGGEIRESKQRVTNVSRGAKPTPVPNKIFNKLKQPSLRIVKAIDDYVSSRK